VAEEFYSFNEALNQLRLKEEELKRLVSEGEIRAFRDGDTMQLRKQDVENLKSELMGGDVIDLGGAGEDLVFEDDADLGDAGMATEEISEMDTMLEDDVEDVGEIDLDDDDDATVAAPVRRTSAIAAAKVEEQTEGMGMRALMILTSLVLLLAMPIAISISTGNPSGIAKSIAGIFGAKMN
jgi:excisionase family DNA binding protein